MRRTFGTSGATLRARALEYGLLATGIAVAIITIVTQLGPKNPSSNPPAVSQPLNR